MAWYATIVLAILYWLSILDRFIIALVVDPIKKDLGITDVQFAVLNGAAFAVAFAVFGLIAGILADRVNRKAVIGAGVVIWSLATALCGAAQNFWHLLIARIGVGAGEATLNPNATSIIADLFPRERLTTAMAVYALGSTLGAGSAYLIGGLVVGLVTKSSVYALPLIGDVRSWQAVFYLVGVPGLFLSLLLLTIPEPKRRGKLSDVVSRQQIWRSAISGYAQLFQFGRRHWQFFLCHYAGFSVASIVVVGAGSWYPAHMGRTFGWSAGQIGASLGVVLFAAGLLGKLIAGLAVDALFTRGFRDAQLRWFATCLALATPVGVYALLSSSPLVFLIALGLFLILVSALPACATAALNIVTPNELRGVGVAAFGTVGSVLGAGLGPLIIASVSDHIFGGKNSIGASIAVLIGVCCPLAAVLLFLGMREMRSLVTAAEVLHKQPRNA